MRGDYLNGGGRKMKNKEKYANEIVEVAIQGRHMGFDKYFRRVVPCCAIQCENCLFHGETSCGQKCLEWANAEYVEPKGFTKREKLFVEALPNIRYVARNKDGTVWAYEWKPEKRKDCFSTEHCLFPIVDRIFGLPFKSVKWSDPEPTSREEILRGSDE